MSFIITLSIIINANAQRDTQYVRKHYNKIDTTIVMRDGIKLYTIIYVPKKVTKDLPFLMERTPYSAGPYGVQNYPYMVGPNYSLMKEEYIFVIQDVRGRYMSEGINLEITPFIANKKSNKEVDESSDTYDTIDWLLKNIKPNNGRVGIAGISYPGFYATASLPDAHPALKAVSPQAPVTDEFIGDDANHNGAFFLMDNFGFMNNFDMERMGPVKDYAKPLFTSDPKDLYQYYLNVGPIKNSNNELYFNKKSSIWTEYIQHDTYDAYWKARNIRPYLKNIKIPTLVVGGWFDAEDLFGALETYASIENQNKINNNHLVMGPWTHGSWEDSAWTNYGPHTFGSNTSQYFQDSLEASFFNFYLKDKGKFSAAEATIFETGSNQWKDYAAWPPKNTVPVPYFFNSNNGLSVKMPLEIKRFNQYVSDPANPVPYTNGILSRRNNEYMTEDQRFVATRPDVVLFKTLPLKEDMVLSGKITADLYVSVSGTDADFIVKLIDVSPLNNKDSSTANSDLQDGGFQQLVRADVMRGKFRNSYENPEPFKPDAITRVKFKLNDVAHSFKKGHQIMVQVQSSWFPLVDRNPQKFMRIPEANESDFQKATIRIYHDATHPSSIILPVLK